MASLVYNPDVSLLIESNTGIVDVSDDLVSGQVILRENAPHTMQIVLQNAQRKYDSRFLPMDNFTLRLKRLNWVQVMTGSLNDPPIFQAFPGALQMSGTCTLKIPQFFDFDSTTASFQAMVLAAMGKNIDARAQEGDNGLSRLIVDSMTHVLRWPKERIHIGAVPNQWFKYVQPVIDLIKQDEQLYAAIGPNYTAAGSYNGVQYPLPVDNYAGFPVDKTQAKNASTIYSTVKSMHLAANVEHAVMVMTFMCAMDESRIRNLGNPNVSGSMSLPHDGTGTDHASVGVFQQQPQWWGPVGKCQDVVAATKNFVSHLVKKLPKGLVTVAPSSDLYGLTIESVQGSADHTGSNYQAFLNPAREVVSVLDKLAKGSTGAGTINGNPITDPAAGYRATGSKVAMVSIDLIDSHKTTPISYVLGGDDPYDTPKDQVTKLDCSSLVDWSYYNSTGKALVKNGRSNVASIRADCILIPLSAAKHIQGAVLIKGANDHVAVSSGDGATCIAAKTNDAPRGKQVVKGDPIDPNGFDVGGLLPGIDYSSSATTKAGQDALRHAGITPKGLAPPLTNTTILGGIITIPGVPVDTTSPFESLINSIMVNATENTSLVGEAIGGYAALINDNYFLPWLQAVINSSMRSFCSAPNGDLIAWFPDYFGAWGTAGVMNVEQIELQNFQVNWSDQQMVTHQFVLGNRGATLLDPATGGISSNSPVNDLLSLATGTAGIASLDFPEIFKIIYGESAPTGWTKAFLSRFGARPDVQQMPNVPQGAAEFFMALYLFQQRWAGQFSASVPMTFMPELFPGMLLRLPAYGFQAYVRGVTHTFQFGPGGTFTTQADICAPSNLGKADRTDLLSLLPLGGRPVAP